MALGKCQIDTFTEEIVLWHGWSRSRFVYKLRLRHIWWHWFGARGRAASKSWSGDIKGGSWAQRQSPWSPTWPQSSPPHLGPAEIPAPWSLHAWVDGSCKFCLFRAPHQLFPLLISRVCCECHTQQAGGQQNYNGRYHLQSPSLLIGPNLYW